MLIGELSICLLKNTSGNEFQIHVYIYIFFFQCFYCGHTLPIFLVQMFM